MARFVFVVLALLAAQALSDVVDFNTTPPKVADKTLLKKQMDLSTLFYHVKEPIYDQELKAIVQSYSLERNVEQFKNVTALKTFLKLQEYNMLVPKGVPFNVLESTHKFEAVTLFNLLYSAKEYSDFYKLAVYLRHHINEGLYVYVLSVAIIHYPETKGVLIPPIYEVFPSYFHNGNIINIAQKINVQGRNYVSYYPQTYLWDDNVVIKWNTTVWPYVDGDYVPMSYYLNDYFLNALYYNNHLAFPYWLSGKSKPIYKYKRGQHFWYVTKEYVTRYYLELLSNGLGEIPELSYDVVYDGYSSGLVYEGVSLPVRPHYFKLDQPKFAEHLQKIVEFEQRIHDGIAIGYFIGANGEKINLRTPEAIDVLGNVIEGNVDSPNLNYYGSILTLWKQLLGNSIVEHKNYWNRQIPLTVPSALEFFQSSVRDPAFYMIMKRVLKIFSLWQSYLPPYKHEELAFPEVTIESVEVDKLVTYFEYNYVNVTNVLPMNEHEVKSGYDHLSVLVQHPQLNHKVFKVKVNVKSDVAKTVLVKFFIAPKYDSNGFEIPLHKNVENFFQFDVFTYELKQGENVIKRESTECKYMIDEWMSGHEVYQKAFKAYSGDGEFYIDNNHLFSGFPRRLMIPKGHIGGMPFKLLVHISEYHTPKSPVGAAAYSEDLHGLGTGDRYITDVYSLGYPLDRKLYEWQVKSLTNFYIEDIQIFHKPVPEIYVPNAIYV
ncbi:acidic juvenile hormone-suppressible protein 1-like [Melitaea cinxia]|uniref:acidic juvenile hormone-suppressible protein 1-like n=1 Tax=Melitaea cinxia TaxID=113334 RepID=UPI001E274C47|nr:acidic juvenile hormone-suppressible protein 1-like [Melitaea cinxia]